MSRRHRPFVDVKIFIQSVPGYPGVVTDKDQIWLFWAAARAGKEPGKTSYGTRNAKKSK
jgi:hypothetical protein